MKTQTPKSESEQKSEMLQAFSQVIDSNTNSPQDLWNLIHAIVDFSEFAEPLRYQFPEDLSAHIRVMGKSISKSLPVYEESFYEIADVVQTGIMLAGSNAPGLILINRKQMLENLRDLLSHSISAPL